jgi:hypothetical protein
MPGKETKVYPVGGKFVLGVPAIEHTVASKAEADELVDSGAFTTEPRDAERDTEAPTAKDMEAAGVTLPEGE